MVHLRSKKNSENSSKEMRSKGRAVFVRSAESAEVLNRMDDTIEISLDYSDYRAKNLAMKISRHVRL